jgi:glycosyltransferase involved in cell wall biosynthesis
VLFTPNIGHYTIGLSQELNKHIQLTLLSTKQFKNITTKQVVIPNLFIPKATALLKWLLYKTYPLFYDIFHVNSALEGCLARKCDKLILTEHGCPGVGIEHEDETVRKYYSKERDALLQLYRAGVPIITISNYSAELLHKTYGIKVHKVVYHGLLKEFQTNKPKRSNSKHTLLWISRLVPMKEPFTFLEALTNIRGIDFRAVIRGDGPLQEAMMIFLKRKHLRDKVFFMGQIPFEKLPILYSSGTIFVHTASREPFGMTVLEAMGLGLPVIVPRSGGAYEVAGTDALSFSTRDPADLADKILSICSDANLYEKQSRRSLDRSKEFTWKKAAKEYLKMYEKHL